MPKRCAEGGRVALILQKPKHRLPTPRRQMAAYGGAVEGGVCELEFPYSKLIKVDLSRL